MQAYLDNSATTRPTDKVIDEMSRAMRERYFNPSSMYREALIPEKEMNECRDLIRRELRAKDARVIFTSGGTESNNLALLGAVGLMRAPIRVAISAVEHPSVLETAERLKEAGAEVVKIPVTGTGDADIGALDRLLDEGISLVSVMQVNNETGAINDIGKISALVREKCPNAKIHVDGVQGFMREDIDFSYIDMYTLSAHKIHGPKGVGALVVKKGMRLKPGHIGGGQEDAYRSGTENTPGISGLKRAIQDMKELPERKTTLMNKRTRMLSMMRSLIPEVKVNGPEDGNGAGHILNISFPGVRGEVMLHALEEVGVLASTGSACSSKKRRVSHVLTAMGIEPARAECALRFSFSPYTTDEEIDYACRKAQEKYEILKRFQRR